jgi:hypothetical protein
VDVSKTRTPRDLALRALRNLNQIRPGKDPDQASMALLLDYWTTSHAALLEDGAVTFGADAIPLYAFNDCAWYLAVEAAPSYGALPIVLQAVGASNADSALDSIKVKLRTSASKPYGHEPMETRYF